MKFTQRRPEDPEINLISLIDVLLMLVIFFMLSSTFVDQGRMRVQLPMASDRPHDNRSAERIVVTVTQQGGYRVNERELVNSSRETLRGAVAAVAGQDRDIRVVLRADARATHQSVVTAMDVLGKMGFSQLDIATVQQTTTQ
ncbi:MAG TPA: biopolymer transporter ExbD [Steroidobacteraceae bacterium]|nr:biopolymer transporter ExbD [Steroidobacteraceae bacterium]